ncbi:PAS domain-containing sensor histidine kinase [Salegentibacter sp. LM13S]|uniref:PAS domain-containing sensor histidine kinase n=1 Tax=Salegentibacter lacus TaxID=2873599 RepID=UPI001CCBBC22|nr:PAS domain-containing sensor histidine kinase [Salegentibacter lacus]MBZ9629989.1 PAS domain-containing sensor histidine kinase [Salegentibacter lacus]
MALKFFKENEQIFNTLFEAASEGVIVVDSQQIIVTANRAALIMFGYEKEELLDEHLNILIPIRYKANHHEHFDRFMEYSEKRQMGHGRDLFGVKKDGTQFPVEAGLNPFKVDGERFVMSLIVDITVRKENQQRIRELNAELEDKIKIRTRELRHTVDNLEKEITKRKEAEKRIKLALKQEKELNELKTKFLSLVSHEFKTPLSGILTSATLAEKYTQAEQQEKRTKHLTTIKNKVHYLNNILNDFLSLERLESGNVNYKYTAFSLNKMVNEVIYNANVTLKYGQEIEYDSELEDITLYQDEKILELILSNLIGNSIKYSPEDSTIYFRIFPTEEKIIFEVEDEGMGIPQKDQKHIFERYFRAENALLNQGTGIGLNIVKVHLENMGGKIKFESVENKGTKFTVTLPNQNR